MLYFILLQSLKGTKIAIEIYKIMKQTTFIKKIGMGVAIFSVLMQIILKL